VFVDIDPKTYNIDPVALEKVLKSYNGEIKGIIPVDIFGQIADYEAICALAGEYGCFVLEDAAQSFCASRKGQKACSFGDIATTSFFPAKPLGCYGDGGMIFTNRDDLKDLLCSLRVHGKGDDKYDNVRIGMNGRLDTMQAAVLLSKFSIFPREIELRQDVTNRYAELLADAVKVPYVEPDNVSAWAQYSVCHPSRDAIIAHLKSADIPTAIYYPQPLHLQTAFQYLGYTQGDFPIAERISNEVFSLPMHPYLTAEEQEQVAQAIRECITRLSDESYKGNL
jgi:dTDP-4-amino-4,6-dideoxygalactose transaminase